jgi:chemotaxis protein CheX
LGTDYSNPFIVGIKHVFKTMCDIDLIDKDPIEKAHRQTTADVTGVMSFTGDRRGTMSFSTSASGALAIYARLMHEEYRGINTEIIDAVGEITNIISGQARKELEKEERLRLMAHVPMVFVGKGIEVHYVTKGAIVSIPFSFSAGGKTEEVSLDYVFE